jgi:DUF1680 family protein
MLFNWRMLEVTGDAKYADLVETCLYNSVLSGISLDERSIFYTNPLVSVRSSLHTSLAEGTDGIYQLFLLSSEHIAYAVSAQNYAYTLSPEGIYCNLYGQIH